MHFAKIYVLFAKVEVGEQMHVAIGIFLLVVACVSSGFLGQPFDVIEVPGRENRRSYFFIATRL